MSIDHYENFPVASFLLPAHLRNPIAVIYHFARAADDIADEGNCSDNERLQQLNALKEGLKRLQNKAPEEPENKAQEEAPLLLALGKVIAAHQLPIGLFEALLEAFSQDIVQKRYATFADLLNYCTRSANPIGRLVLHLVKRTNDEQLYYSDCICSALQLINFWQDVGVDLEKNRLYLPEEDLARFDVTERAIFAKETSQNWQALMAFETARARDLMRQGLPLVHQLQGRIGIEIRFTILGGLTILDKIDAVKGDVFNHRPQLTKWDWVKMGTRIFAL